MSARARSRLGASPRSVSSRSSRWRAGLRRAAVGRRPGWVGWFGSAGSAPDALALRTTPLPLAACAFASIWPHLPSSAAPRGTR